MPTLGPMEWILILLVLILLFGAKKLPDTAKALGQSLRLFKKETTKLNEDDDAKQAQTPAPAQATVQQQPSLPPAGPSVEDRLRTLEEENARLRTTAQTPSAPSSPAPKDQGSA
ncbi:Sec-independent protein translocase subunit TatA [Sphaerisporangium sp. B11E5]|uniref:Sec-independent protein translocase subunit TatA n=1 Tax=Sphaerisporangium sp. B11E5 TaxID=3153563 RepID=UPI00325C9DB9